MKDFIPIIDHLLEFIMRDFWLRLFFRLGFCAAISIGVAYLALVLCEKFLQIFG